METMAKKLNELDTCLAPFIQTFGFAPSYSTWKVECPPEALKKNLYDE